MKNDKVISTRHRRGIKKFMFEVNRLRDMDERLGIGYRELCWVWFLAPPFCFVFAFGCRVQELIGSPCCASSW